MVSLKRLHFSVYHCVFFPPVVRILVGRLDSCFLTHIKKYMHMTHIHALIYEKHMSKCVFILDRLKSQCKLITLWGEYVQQKKVGWEVIFSEHEFAGSGRVYVSPGRSLRAAPSRHFFDVVLLRLNGL